MIYLASPYSDPAPAVREQRFEAACAVTAAMVGSIGVLSMHVDWSRWNEQQGLGVTYIHAGKYKVEGNADAPLDKESRAQNAAAC